jgi:hypothetical protein
VQLDKLYYVQGGADAWQVRRPLLVVLHDSWAVGGLPAALLRNWDGKGQAWV